MKVAYPIGMTHERAGRILAGISVAVAAALAYFHHPLWMLAAGGIALNLILSGITDRCVVKDLLIRMGLPGERDLGRAEAGRRAAPQEARRLRPEVSREFAPTTRTSDWQNN